MVQYLDGVQQVEVISNPIGTQTVSVSGTPTVYAQNKINTPAAYTTAITVASPYTTAAQDMGSTIAYKTMRIAVLYDQPVKVEVYNGASATVTSNKIFLSQTVAANTPTTIDFPVSARYVGIKVTNTGAATTTVQTLQYVAFSQ